jgi:cAMP phosphodiesterase
MEFTHYTLESTAYDPNRSYDQSRPKMKPDGLWLSVDGDWERFLIEIGEYNGYHKTQTIKFKVDTSKWLVLKNAQDLDRFTDEYVNVNTNAPYSIGQGVDQFYIDWFPLSQEYGGIMIAPYVWERRLTQRTIWYYPWDVASACVWDLSSVEVI